jgi:hypothetical protein
MAALERRLARAGATLATTDELGLPARLVIDSPQRR